MANDEEVKTLAVKLAMEDSSFSAGIKDLKSKLGVIDSEFKSSVAGLKNWGTSLDGLKSNAQALGEKINVQKQIIKAYTDQLKVSEDALKQNSQKLLDNKTKVESAREAYEKSAASIGKEADETKALKDELKKAEEAFKNSESLVRNNQKSIQGYTIQLNDANGKLKTFESQLSQTNSKIDAQTSKLLKAQAIFKEVGTGLITAGEKISGIGTKLDIGVTAPIVAMGVAAAKTSTDFQDGLAKISTIADTEQMSIKNIGNGVIDLSDKTGKSVEDLNEALYQAISSGIQTGDTLTFMDSATKAAVGGFTDTETAVDGLTTVLNAYGMSAKEVNNIANQMMVTQNLGKTTFGELAQTIGNAIPTFASANIGTKEFFSSMGVLTANGIKTSEAVTGLKAALSNIIKPTKEASDAAGALNLKFDAGELSKKGWLPFLQEVKAKMKDAAPEYVKAADKVSLLTDKITALTKSGSKNTTELKNLKIQLKNAKGDMDALEKSSSDQLSAFATMFGSVEGLNTVLTLTSDQGVKLYNESLQQMGSKTDYVSDAFEKVTNTTGKDFSKSLNDLKNASIKAGDTLSPLIEDMSKGITSLADSYKKLTPEQQKSITQSLAFAAAAGPVLTITGKMTSGIGGFFKTTGKALGGVKNFVNGLKGIEPVAGATVSGAAKLGTKLAALGGPEVLIPIAAVTAGIGLITAAVIASHTKTDELIESINKERTSWNESKKAAEDKAGADLALIGRTKDLWNEMQTVVDSNGKIKSGYEDRVKFITGALNDALGTEIKVNGNVVTSYKNISDQIDNLIAKKRAQILLEANEENYKKALQDYQNKENDQTKLYIQLANKKNDVLKEEEKFNSWVHDKTHTAGDVAGEKAWLDKMKGELAKLQTAYNDNQSYLQDYYKTINNYETASAASTKGNYAQVEKILNSTTVAYSVATGATRTQLEQQALEANVKLKLIRQEYDDHVQGVTGDMVNTAKDAAGKANEEFLKVGNEAGKGITLGLDSQGQLIYESGEKAGLKVTDGSKSVDYDKYGKEAGSKLIAGASSVDGKNAGKKLGSDFSSGYVNGMFSKLTEITNAGASIADAAKKAVQKAQNSHSPSKVAMKLGGDFGEGYRLGMVEKLNSAADSADETIKKLTKKITGSNSKYISDALKEEVGNIQEQISNNYKTLVDKITARNKQLSDDTKKIVDDYNSALSNKESAIYGSTGLFSEVSTTDVTKSQLTENLQNQVSQLKNWQTDLNNLSGRGAGSDLIKELEDMGPQAADQIHALTTMSDEELKNYVALWKQKHQLAKDESVGQLEDLKNVSIKKIKELQTEAAKDLDGYKSTWVNAMDGIKNHIKTLTGQINQYGRELVQNLAAGMNSSLPTLDAAVSNITGNIYSQLHFTRPDTGLLAKYEDWMPHFMEGLADGVKVNKYLVADSIGGMASDIVKKLNILPSFQLNSASNEIKLPSREFMSVAMNTQSNVKAASQQLPTTAQTVQSAIRGGDVNFNNIFNGKAAESPSEVTRQEKNMLRQLGLGFK